MGDIVEEMDTHRRKSFALLTRKGAEGRCELEEGEQLPMPRASRSFSKVAPLPTRQTLLCCRLSCMALASPVLRCLLSVSGRVNRHEMQYRLW